MPALTIDLDAQLENLVGLKTDVEEHYWSVAEEADAKLRFGLGLVLSQLTARIGALEEAARHHGGGHVSVRRLSSDELRALERALDVLDGELVVEMADPPARLWTKLRELLAAADELLLATARADRIAGVEHDSGPRPGIVLPLARSIR